ncbi:MAG: hypothetical protein AB1644_12035 [Candidatus Zixiibacteriota bacterium]
MSKLSFVTVVIIGLLTTSVLGATSKPVVKYLSAENVYLSIGKAEGLSVGDRLVITSRSKCRTEVEVLFVAEHSASCKRLTDSCTLAVGDVAKLVATAPRDTVASAVDSSVLVAQAEPVDTVTPEAPKSYTKPSAPKITGNLSVLYYHWDDRSASNLDFSQITGRFNLKARRLFGQELTFSIRSRGRYDQRQRTYSSQVSRNAWENRIWEFSISYEEPGALVNAYAGRILPRRAGSAGYLDGLLMEARISQNVRIGMFGGREPLWAFSEDQLPIMRTGGYVTLMQGEPGKSYFEESVAGIGEYADMVVSREYIALQGRYNAGSTWGMYHTAEIDVNRRWRRETTGQSVDISSLYLGVYYRLHRRVRLSLSYDNRTNYRTLETRSTVDSLFDDHLRQGMRTQLDLSLPLRIQTAISYGLRNREGDPSVTRSYSFSVNKSELWRSTAMFMGMFAGFDGPFEHGHNYSVRISDNLMRRVMIGTAYGLYSYSAESDNTNRRNQWYELFGQGDLSRHYFLGGSVQFDTGDDIEGMRLQTELGYRF